MHMDRANHEPEDLETYKQIERNFIGVILRIQDEEEQRKYIDLHGISYENGFWYKNGLILHLSDIEFEPLDKELGHDPIRFLSRKPRFFERFYDPWDKKYANITHDIIQYAHLMVEKMKQRALVRTLEDTLIEQTPDIEEDELAPTLATMEAAAVVPESQIELPSIIMTTDGDSVPADEEESREDTTTPDLPLSPIQKIENFSRVPFNEASHESGEQVLEEDDDDDGEEQASNDRQLQQQESEPSPSHSSASAKTNNDNGDNNNNPDALDDHNQEVSERFPSHGRYGPKRVKKKNRIYEDFYCMKPKKGGRLGSHNEYYEVFASAASEPRAPSRRPTVESRSSESLGNAAGTSEIDQDPNKPAGESPELMTPTRYCKKCRKRTVHDMDRKCQVCLYKRIQSASKRQETLRLKAQAAAAAAATEIDPNQQQDEVREAEQSRATSASSSVANTPTSLDGSLLSVNGGGSISGSSKNKRKARSQGGRSSKQPAAAVTPIALPTVHDTEETDMPIADSIPTVNPTIEHISHNKVDEPESIIKDPEPPQHNTSSGSDASIDTNITGSSSSSTATTSGNTSASSTSNTQTGATAKQQTPPTTNTLKITTTLKTDERGKKRWVVKSSSGSGTQNSENAPASDKRDSDLPSSQTSSVADVTPSESEPAKATPVNTKQGDNQTKQSSKVASIEPESMATKKPSDTRSAPMEKSNGVSKADNNNTTNNNPSQTKGDDSQNQPQLTKVDVWTPEDVAQYVSSRGFTDASELFKVQAVDGMSLLLMKRTDFTHGLKMKLGPALKLFDQVCKLKREYFALSATAS